MEGGASVNRSDRVQIRQVTYEDQGGIKYHPDAFRFSIDFESADRAIDPAAQLPSFLIAVEGRAIDTNGCQISKFAPLIHSAQAVLWSPSGKYTISCHTIRCTP